MVAARLSETEKAEMKQLIDAYLNQFISVGQAAVRLHFLRLLFEAIKSQKQVKIETKALFKAEDLKWCRATKRAEQKLRKFCEERGIPMPPHPFFEH